MQILISQLTKVLNISYIGKFKNSISESLRISRNQPDDSANNSGQFGKLSKLNISRPLNMNTNSMNTPVSRSRAKS